MAKTGTSIAGYGFLAKLAGHDAVEQKILKMREDDRNEKQMSGLYPPSPDKNDTTEFGEWYDSKATVKADSFMANMTSYFTQDIVNIQHKNAIRKYRDISMMPEVEAALDERVNGILIFDPENPDFLKVDYVDGELFTEDLKEAINAEHETVLGLLDFRHNAFNLVRQWLVDGVQYFENVYQKSYVGRGMIDVNYLDGMFMTYVQEFDTDASNGVKKASKEYYVFQYPQSALYNSSYAAMPFSTLNYATNQRAQIEPDFITYVDSNRYHPIYRYPISYLHRALKVASQLRMLEDAILVYRITRAPERRVFYIDIGGMSASKGEELISELADEYRHQRIYNSSTGEIDNGAAVISMIEDFWLPRRNGQSATDVDVLSGAQNLGEITDLDFFNKKLWMALGVPYTRRQSQDQGGVNFSRGMEITVEEVKFHQENQLYRRQYERVVADMTLKNLILKRIINSEDIGLVLRNLKYQWNEDNYFYQMLHLDVRNQQFDLLTKIDDRIEKQISDVWIAKEVLNFTDNDIATRADERMNPAKYGFKGSAAMEEENAEEEAPAGGGESFGGSGDSSGPVTSEPTEGDEEAPAEAPAEEAAPAAAPAETRPF
jgi:hypothetical protein